jgi:hypothetical protein
MKTKIHPDHSFEFYFPDLDTQLLVEEIEDKVVIHASRNTFSDQRKARFLRHLAAEGFIPDEHQWFSGFKSQGSQVCWLVDTSWVGVPKAIIVRSRNFMIRLLISATLLWLGLMAAVLFHWI